MTSLIVIGALLGIGIALFLGILTNKIGMPCTFCENRRTTPFSELPEQDKKNLLEYFQTYEKRAPDRDGIFVCENCKIVYDDFSGEKKSMETDLWGPRTFCKVCNNIMLHCDLKPNRQIRCRRCKTEYHWQIHEPSGFRLLMPPPNAKVLSKCADYTFGNM